MSYYIAEVYTNFEMSSEFITLKATNYNNAVKELENIIDKNPTVLGGKLI